MSIYGDYDEKFPLPDEDDAPPPYEPNGGTLLLFIAEEEEKPIFETQKDIPKVHKQEKVWKIFGMEKKSNCIPYLNRFYSIFLHVAFFNCDFLWFFMFLKLVLVYAVFSVTLKLGEIW